MAKEIEIDVKELGDEETVIPFEGKVTIKVKPYTERLALAQEMSALMDKKDNASLSKKMIDLAYSNVTTIDVAMAGKKFNDLDELGYYKEGADLINKIASVVASGPSLGN